MIFESKAMKYIDGNEESITANLEDWVVTTTAIARDERLFSQFRSLPIVTSVVEGTPWQGGLWNLKRIINNKYFLKAIDYLLESDRVGFPSTLVNFKLGDRAMALSPTTIRYANNFCNCIEIFGKGIIENPVYEIGGGYGGECKTFNDFLNSSFQLKPDWSIFDLKSSYGLISKWLGNFGYEANFLNIEDNFHIKANGFAISNAALSEMRGELLENYINKVLLNCQYGYFITNFELLSKPYGGWTTEQFVAYLIKNGKKDVRVLDPLNYLSYFDYQAQQKLIVFGVGQYAEKNKLFIRDRIQLSLSVMLSGVSKRMNANFLK